MGLEEWQDLDQRVHLQAELDGGSHQGQHNGHDGDLVFVHLKLRT